MSDSIDIETSRYSKVVSAFVDRYPDAIVKLDKQAKSGPASHWCTNAALLGAINFSIRRGKTDLLGFHDGPRNMWASAEALPLIQELADKRILRYRVSASRPPHPSWLVRLRRRFGGA